MEDVDADEEVDDNRERLPRRRGGCVPDDEGILASRVFLLVRGLGDGGRGGDGGRYILLPRGGVDGRAGAPVEMCSGGPFARPLVLDPAAAAVGANGITSSIVSLIVRAMGGSEACGSVCAGALSSIGVPGRLSSASEYNDALSVSSVTSAAVAAVEAVGTATSGVFGSGSFAAINIFSSSSSRGVG